MPTAEALLPVADTLGQVRLHSGTMSLKQPPAAHPGGMAEQSRGSAWIAADRPPPHADSRIQQTTSAPRRARRGARGVPLGTDRFAVTSSRRDGGAPSASQANESAVASVAPGTPPIRIVRL